MKIREVLQYLEAFAPPMYQESYDNSGLLVGNANETVTGVLLCLDSIEAVMDEAIEKKCNLVIAHHPIIFGGLKRLNGKNYIERTVIKAIKNDIAIYACHTNLDNVRRGVNAKISACLGLKNLQILAPKSAILRKLVVFVPDENAPAVRQALFSAGAGEIGNYDEASFNSTGFGTFRAKKGANPHVGDIGKQHHEPEVKIEVIYPKDRESRIIQAMIAVHPYETVAYDIFQLENPQTEIGSGMIGELEEAMEELEFLKFLKKTMGTDCIRYTELLGRQVKRVAVCGGAGSFLLNQAIRQQADIFVTADYKYHQFFDADNQIIIADIGHFESEQYTIDLFYDIITKKFDTFAVCKTEVPTNPVNYL